MLGLGCPWKVFWPSKAFVLRKAVQAVYATQWRESKWFTPRQMQQFPLCRFTKTNVCHCNISNSNQTSVVPWQWWYIVAFERDILLCWGKWINNPVLWSPLVDWNSNKMPPSNKCQYKKKTELRCLCLASSCMHKLTFRSDFSLLYVKWTL